MYRQQEFTDFQSKFFELISGAEKIVITSHKSPDDDSIASVLAMYQLLCERYPVKSIRIIYSGEAVDRDRPVSRYQSFQNFDRIEFVADVADHLGGVDCLIILDGSQYHRVSDRAEKIQEFAGLKICIDHHGSSVDEFDLSLVIPEISSNAELVYRVFFQDQGVEITQSLAETFMLGILGDTGNFAYLKPSQVDTLTVAKDLIEIGKIEIQELQSRYQKPSVRVFTLLQEFIKNTQYHEIKNWPNFQVSLVTREFVSNGEYSDNEVVEAKDIYLHNYIRNIQGYSWGFTIVPIGSGVCKISLRSLPGSVNVRELSERMSLGGGHDRAAGGTFKVKDGQVRDVAECLEEVLEWMRKN